MLTCLWWTGWENIYLWQYLCHPLDFDDLTSFRRDSSWQNWTGDRMDKVMEGRSCLSNVQTCDNESLSTMNYSIRLMMSVRRIQSQPAGSSTNTQALNVGVDCSAADREWELYGVDGLLNYDLYCVLSRVFFVLLHSLCVFFIIFRGISVFVGK